MVIYLSWETVEFFASLTKLTKVSNIGITDFRKISSSIQSSLQWDLTKQMLGCYCSILLKPSYSHALLVCEFKSQFDGSWTTTCCMAEHWTNNPDIIESNPTGHVAVTFFLLNIIWNHSMLIFASIHNSV